MNSAIDTQAHAEDRMAAAEMADAYRRRVEFYRQYYKFPAPQAAAEAERPPCPEYLERLPTMPPEDVSWLDLQILADRDPEQAQQFWEGVKQAAREDLSTKRRAALVLEGDRGSPWERAQFSALCRELADGWQPRTGIERQLLDTMALAHTAMLGWLARLTQVNCWPRERELRDRNQSEGAGWTPPRVSEAEALEQAAAMVERFQRIFTRSLRSLHTLRRLPPVLVQGAGQVNIGQQQVNVSG